MVSYWKGFLDFFWDESLWLGNGTKWADVTNGPDKKILYPDTSDFLYQILLVFVFIIGRHALERYCFVPVGQLMGIKQKKLRYVQDIPLLQSAYRKSQQIKDVTALAKQLDMSEHQIERWWRYRKNADKPSKLTKFCEHAWKASYCGINSAVGIYILWDKDYFWDLDKCIIGHPHFGVTNDVWWFYMVNCAYMYSSLIMVFTEVRRKDFLQTVFHHVVTSIILAATWMVQFYRLAVVLLPLLDASECLIEVAKALKTARYDRACRYVFYLFTLGWFYVRIYFLLFQYFYRTSELIRMWTQPIAGLLIVMLFFIIVLQVYWTALILQIIYNAAYHGVERDVRSSSSEASYSQASADEIIDYSSNHTKVNDIRNSYNSKSNKRRSHNSNSAMGYTDDKSD